MERLIPEGEVTYKIYAYAEADLHSIATGSGLLIYILYGPRIWSTQSRVWPLILSPKRLL